MQDFDYVIIGGGCAGLSLAYSLEVNHKLRGKSLAIIEPRKNTSVINLGHFGRLLSMALMNVKKVGPNLRLRQKKEQNHIHPHVIHISVLIAVYFMKKF